MRNVADGTNSGPRSAPTITEPTVLQRDGVQTTCTPLNWANVLWAALPAVCCFAMVARPVRFSGLAIPGSVAGDGPPLLLVHGWPQTWYYWRLVMPALARDFSVVAVDQRPVFSCWSPAASSTPAMLAESSLPRSKRCPDNQSAASFLSAA